MAAEDFYFAMLTYYVSTRAFGIISADASQSYEEQILKENILAFLAQIAYTQYRTMHRIITQQGTSTAIKNILLLYEQHSSHPEVIVSLTNRAISFLKRELEALLRHVLLEASKTIFYRVLDLSKVYQQYSTLKGTGMYANGSLHYTDFVSNIHNVILNTTNRQLIASLYNYLFHFYKIKYSQLFYIRHSATGTVLTLDEQQQLNQQ